MLGRLTNVLSALFVVALTACGVAMVYVGYSSHAVIEQGLERALGVDARIDEVDYRPLSRQLHLQALGVSNPRGYGGEHLLRIAEGYCEVSPGDLGRNVVTVPRLTLNGLDLVVEQSGVTTNAQEVLATVSAGTARLDDPRLRLLIGSFVANDVVARVSLDGPAAPLIVSDASRWAPGEGRRPEPSPDGLEATVRLGRIQLANLGGAEGIGIGELCALLLETLLERLESRGIPLPRPDVVAGVAGPEGVPG